MNKPYLNLGCGRLIFPTLDKPAHHDLIPSAMYTYPDYLNVDRNQQPGVDRVVNLFEYPWPLPSDSFDGAIISHVCEHIPHEIKIFSAKDAYGKIEANGIDPYPRADELKNCQDGWFAFFAELYRVLTDGATVHILSPYAWSQGGITDPTHTRYLTPETFRHSMQPDPDAPFAYSTGGIHFEIAGDVHYTPMFQYAHMVGDPERFKYALQHELNVVTDFHVMLECIK